VREESTERVSDGDATSVCSVDESG
jgi:hypothetical protein